MSRLGLILAIALLGVSPSRAREDILGEWWTPGFNARVLVYPCEEKACGKITWLWQETPHDIADRQTLIGRTIFTGLVRGTGSKWQGRIYNPEDGRSYASDVALISSNTLEVNGCVMFICKRQVWRRYDPARCPAVTPREPIE
jgi:uncharacterized protein (DUF2147 family)